QRTQVAIAIDLNGTGKVRLPKDPYIEDIAWPQQVLLDPLGVQTRRRSIKRLGTTGRWRLARLLWILGVCDSGKYWRNHQSNNHEYLGFHRFRHHQVSRMTITRFTSRGQPRAMGF